jgi:hypothetical protein
MQVQLSQLLFAADVSVNYSAQLFSRLGPLQDNITSLASNDWVCVLVSLPCPGLGLLCLSTVD